MFISGCLLGRWHVEILEQILFSGLKDKNPKPILKNKPLFFLNTSSYYNSAYKPMYSEKCPAHLIIKKKNKKKKSGLKLFW